jgi:hypothetical protein
MRVVKLPALIEPVPILDDFVQGIGRIEQVGPCARFILFSDQTLYELGNTPSRVVVRKLVVPIDALPSAIKQATDFLAMRVFNNVFRIRG